MTLTTVPDDETPTPCLECADHPGVTSNPSMRGLECPSCSGSGRLVRDTQLVPPVILGLPDSLLEHGSVQLLVQHHTWGVEVAVRPAEGGAWTPATFAGIDVERRPA